MKSLEELSDVVTPEEAGSIFKIPTEDVNCLLENGDIPGFKLGPYWRILKTSLIDFLQTSGGAHPVSSTHVQLNDEVKVGQLVRDTMTDLLREDRIPADEIERLKTLDYSNRVFGLNHPFLKDFNHEQELKPQVRDTKGYSRYWNNVFANKFLITSQWTLKHRKHFIQWAQQF